MSARTENRGPRWVLLVAATAALLTAGGVGVAYATAENPAVETGYAVISTQTEASDQTWTEQECEQWKARQQGEQLTPSDSEQSTPGSGAQPSPSGSTPSDVTGRL